MLFRSGIDSTYLWRSEKLQYGINYKTEDFELTNTLIIGCGSITIPNSITSIGSYAFNNYMDITSITIPINGKRNSPIENSKNLIVYTKKL